MPLPMVLYDYCIKLFLKYEVKLLCAVGLVHFLIYFLSGIQKHGVEVKYIFIFIIRTVKKYRKRENLFFKILSCSTPLKKKSPRFVYIYIWISTFRVFRYHSFMRVKEMPILSRVRTSRIFFTRIRTYPKVGVIFIFIQN